MQNRRQAARRILLALCLAAAGGWQPVCAGTKPADSSAAETANKKAESPDRRPYVTEVIRGRAVWLDEALKEGFGVTTEPAAAKTAIVIETQQGKLWPVVPDTRGRAFAVDERLRDRALQLLVRRYEDVPMVQVIRVFEQREDGLYEIDYWCDICAIPMYILKPCECCQGDTRLRERPAERPIAGD